MAEPAALEAKVSGLVQGVAYRAFVRGKASQKGLSGWAKNQPDGSVLVRAEGDRDQLEALVRDLEQGPSAARVKRVDAKWSNYTGKLHGFRIYY